MNSLMPCSAPRAWPSLAPSTSTTPLLSSIASRPLRSTANTASARTVRVQIITPPGSLNRDGQRQITRAATDIIARAAGDPSLAARTWVILSEAAEGGWGIAGTAFGAEEFTALASMAAAAKAAAGS